MVQRCLPCDAHDARSQAPRRAAAAHARRRSYESSSKQPNPSQFTRRRCHAIAATVHAAILAITGFLFFRAQPSFLSRRLAAGIHRLTVVVAASTRPGHEIRRRLHSPHLCSATTPALPSRACRLPWRGVGVGVGREAPVPAAEAAAGGGRKGSGGYTAAERRRRRRCHGSRGEPRHRRRPQPQRKPEEADAEQQVESEAELAGS
ncbi:hypothetical protein BDA96_09G188800 [Sorghum bicolor]|uniref:Uncharacterized protein n=1 Tax=Sorghum bicolor TaxID=4558 RepID=A0A921U5J6_SORBI|nr:hypothetical protein BDA96_09G188800 [Sorghum bicolor]